MLLRLDRLLAFSDSVIVVAVVLLVYNLATFATTEPNAFQSQIFFSTLIVYVGSFIVVFFFWLTFTTLLEYIKNLNDIVASLFNISNTCYSYASWKCTRTTAEK
ncbi:MAG: TMEM175 family protein [Nitrososphaeraceae archaeon]